MTSSGLTRMGAGRSVAAVLAALSAAACMAAASGASAAVTPEVAARQATWREAISHTPAPKEGGCFAAHYPVMAWSKAACVTAPNIPLAPKTGHGDGPLIVGGGDDYAIKTETLISTGVGSFPKVVGLTSEKADRHRNAYTLQLDSDFFNGPACAGAQTPSKCLTWLQYVYLSNGKAAYMQYWLISWNQDCPAGWNQAGPSCWKNSKAVSVPQEAITDLSQMSLTGSAVDGGVDTTLFMDGPDAYTATAPDDVLFLASNWNRAEFNVLGLGAGYEAYFNAGTTLTVDIAVTDGSTTKPKCLPNAGTTAATNNLNLGKGKAKAGDTPSISFTESD